MLWDHLSTPIKNPSNPFSLNTGWSCSSPYWIVSWAFCQISTKLFSICFRIPACLALLSVVTLAYLVDSWRAWWQNTASHYTPWEIVGTLPALLIWRPVIEHSIQLFCYQNPLLSTQPTIDVPSANVLLTDNDPYKHGGIIATGWV